MNQMPDRYVYPGFRKYILLWMKIFTPICLALSVSLYFFHGPEYSSYENFSILLPFVNLVVIYLIFGVYSIYWRFHYDEYYETQYLKTNYPKIWKKLHPWGDCSVNGFASLFFMYGKYDDGSDMDVIYIRQNQKENLKMLLWVFLLVPVSWCISTGILLVAG